MPLKEEKEKFQVVAKRILKKEISTNAETLRTYRTDIIQAYNCFTDYVTGKILRLTKQEEELKDIYVEAQQGIREKLVLCLQNLKLSYKFSDRLFEKVDDSKIIDN